MSEGQAVAAGRKLSLPPTSTLLRWACVCVVVKTLAVVVVGLARYFPPDFQAEFLEGRQAYFYGSYQCAFYAHVITGPITLVSGLFLLSSPLRVRYRRLHRRLGLAQAAFVLLVLFPSGLAMAFHARGGPIARLGFAALAVATATACALGFRDVLNQHYDRHELWMRRTFILLASAVVLRLVGGAGTLLHVWTDLMDPLMAWASWLAPAAFFETLRLRARDRSAPAPGA